MSADAIASAVLKKYEALPSKGKPRVRSNGASEWTVLAGFCFCDVTAGTVDCISLGTGLKVLPHSKLPTRGDILHDSHAEVIARRGLLLYLSSQLRLAAAGTGSVLELVGEARWHLQPHLSLALYVSMLPCGDASTYLLSQTTVASGVEASVVDGAPRSPAHSSMSEAAALGLHTSRTASILPQVHRGRVAYNTTSTLRTKPGRPDSPPSTSHSCSDKIAMWGACGVQGALLSRWIDKLTISHMVVGEVLENHRDVVKVEVERAVGGRVGQLGTTPRVSFTDLQFSGRRGAEDFSCPESISFVKDFGSEVLVNGIKQGAATKRKDGAALGPKSRSRLCKLELFRIAESISECVKFTSYFAAKHSVLEYQAMKDATRVEGAPLHGWLVSGQNFESFRSDGSLP